MKFLISVIDDLTAPASATEMAQIDQFNDELRANNQFIFAWGLEVPSTATSTTPTLRIKGAVSTIALAIIFSFYRLPRNQ